MSFFEFPKSPIRQKQWIHAIRRDEGKQWHATHVTKVCLLHFRREDLRKSLNGQLYVATGSVPSKFAWSVPSPRKRKAPTERILSGSSKKQLFMSDEHASSSNMEVESVLVVESPREPEASSSINSESKETSEPVFNSKPSSSGQMKQIKELEAQLLIAQQELTSLRLENTELKRKLAESTSQQEAMSSRIFCLDRLKSDADISFYTGLPNYSTFTAIYEFFNPGEDCENIRPRSSSDVPEEFYNTDSSDEEENVQAAKKGRCRKLRPVEEFFIVLCRLRRGFSERHLANLYGVAQSTVSRLFIPWINFVYLKFGQVCIWPSKAVVQQTVPADFREKFPSTRVVSDCTEVFCEMPSSLLLNSELFSSYKNHVTLKGLVGISPSGAITFEPTLYRKYF